MAKKQEELTTETPVPDTGELVAPESVAPVREYFPGDRDENRTAALAYWTPGRHAMEIEEMMAKYKDEGGYYLP